MASTDNTDLQQSNRQKANFNFNLYAFHALLLLFCVHFFLKYSQLLKIAQAIVAYGLIVNFQLTNISNRLYQLRATIFTLLIIFLSTCGIAIASNAVSVTSTSDNTALFYDNDINDVSIQSIQLKASELDTDLEQTEKFLASTLTETSVVNSSVLLSAAAAFTVGIFDGVYITPATNTKNNSYNSISIPINNNNNNSSSNSYTSTNTSNNNNNNSGNNSSTTTTNNNNYNTKQSFTFNSTVSLASEVASSSTVFDSSDATLFKASNTSLEAETEVNDEFKLPSIQAILVSIILLFVILGTVVGNVLVCIAVCMVRKLRRPCNYLLVSLALSDLCVAVLVMPMALLYEVLEKWNFGPLLCDIWVSFDVLCCTASILNLCAISVDRYLAITKPLEYGVKRTPRRMMLCVALVWLAAACISLPPLLILGNEHMDEQGEPVCQVCQNFAYQIYATLGSFYIPLAVMLFVYYQIFRAAHRIVLEEKRAQTHLQHALNGTGTQPQPSANQVPSGGSGGGGGGGCGGSGSGNGQRHSSYGNTSLSYSACGVLNAHDGSGGSGVGVSGSSNLLGSPHQKKIRFQLAKEKKASTTLGIIMSAFTICWLPFFILALIRPFVESESTHVPQSLSSLFLWLGYANSLLNPIIYATLNRDFRKPFQAILYFRCSSLNTMMRENYYQDQYGEPPSQRVMLGDERHGARESFL